MFKSIYHTLLDWSELWALLIPLTILFLHKKQPVYLRPVKYYVYTALLINSLIILIWLRNKYHWNFFINKMEDDDNNNFLYNIHSICRLFLFSWFFILLKQPFARTVKKILPVIFLLFIVINFIFFENFIDIGLSSRLLSIEAGILLFYCMQYYLNLLREEHTSFMKMPSFWVVTGLSIYVVASFPIFLFYEKLPALNKTFSVSIWDVHNIAFILLCIFIAKSFYGSRR
jgi:hypothetical protein